MELKTRYQERIFTGVRTQLQLMETKQHGDFIATTKGCYRSSRMRAYKSKEARNYRMAAHSKAHAETVVDILLLLFTND